MGTLLVLLTVGIRRSRALGEHHRAPDRRDSGFRIPIEVPKTVFMIVHFQRGSCFQIAMRYVRLALVNGRTG